MTPTTTTTDHGADLTDDQCGLLVDVTFEAQRDVAKSGGDASDLAELVDTVRDGDPIDDDARDRLCGLLWEAYDTANGWGNDERARRLRECKDALMGDA